MGVVRGRVRTSVRKAVLATLALLVMPGCGCGQHRGLYGAYDWINAHGPLSHFSRGKWWGTRNRWSDALIRAAQGQKCSTCGTTRELCVQSIASRFGACCADCFIYSGTTHGDRR